MSRARLAGTIYLQEPQFLARELQALMVEWVLGALALLGALVVLGAVLNLLDYLKEKKQQQEKERLESHRRNLGLTCARCASLALPIRWTNNRYRCEKCGRQFAGARHEM